MPDINAFYLNVLNQTFELEKRLGARAEERPLARPLARIRSLFEQDLPGGGGLLLHDPTGENYKDTRTDVDASIAGAPIATGAGSLQITETLKPIIYHQRGPSRVLVQRGVVIVEGIPL